MSSHHLSYRLTRALRRGALVAGSAALLLSLQLGAGIAVSGCDEPLTAGKRIVLHTRITAGKEATAPFKNAYGWSITLTRAYLSVGELYYFNGEPVVAQGGPGLRRRAPGLFAIPSAHAHPGHYTEGDAYGQMLTPITVDILKDTALPDGDGITGVYRSARFEYAEKAAGALAKDLGNHVVLVEGEAKKGDAVRLFRIAEDQADVLNADGNPFVEGCIFEESEIPAEGTVVLTVKPSVWLDQVDFENVAESEDGEPVEVVTGEKAHKAFARGLQKGTGFGFSYEEGAAK